MTKTNTKLITVAPGSAVAHATPCGEPSRGADGAGEKIYVRPSWRALMHLLPQLDGEFPLINLHQELDGSLRVDFGTHIAIEVTDRGVSLAPAQAISLCGRPPSPLDVESLRVLAVIFATISAAEMRAG